MANRRKIKIFFTDFWAANYDQENNFFSEILKKRFNIEIDPDNPDILIYSLNGENHKKYSCIKVLFVGENIRPNYNLCDFSISFDYSINNGRNLRLPLYVLYKEVDRLIKTPEQIEKILSEKRKFCNMLVSNPNAKFRIDFFRKLSEYKKVDSGGKVENNIGYRVKDRFEFVKQYKFTLAFENTSYPGYTTEKIVQPVKAGSIPIYWGNPLVHLEFNPKSFINVMNFKSPEHAIEYIAKVDNDTDLYRQILEEPFFYGNRPNEYYDENRILNFFDMIVNLSNYTPVAQTWKRKLYPVYSYRKKFAYYVLKKNLWNQ